MTERVSLRTNAHAVPFVIANQSSDWCGNLGRGATYQLAQEDSHGSVRTASE